MIQLRHLEKIVLVAVAAVFALFLISLAGFTDVKGTPTGNFILGGGYATAILSAIILGLSLFPFVKFNRREREVGLQKTVSELSEKQVLPKEELQRAFADLFLYSTRENYDESKLYDAGKRFVNTAKSLAAVYRMKLSALYQNNAEDKLVHWARHVTEDIKHTTHTGTRYVMDMRKDLYDGKVDDPQILKGALRFLESDGVKPYAQLAQDLYRVFDRVLR